jgi:hypothetical protein
MKHDIGERYEEYFIELDPFCVVVCCYQLVLKTTREFLLSLKHREILIAWSTLEN